MCPEPVAGRPTFDRLDWAILLSVAVTTSIWCLTASQQLGATFDEPFYIASGLDFWRNGSRFDMLNTGVMPLSTHLQTLPLWIMERATGHASVWDQNASRMLTVARSVTLVFWWLLLFYTMRLGHAIAGAWAGRLSVMLLGFDPNFLAHASVATTDLGLAACLVMFAYYFRAGRDRHWRWRVALPGFLFALAMLAKASAVVFGPLAMLLIEVEHLTRTRAIADAGASRSVARRWWPLSRGLRVDGLIILVIGIVLAVAYCGTGGGPSFQDTLARMPLDNPVRPFLAWFSALPLFPNGLYVIYFQFVHNKLGHPTYLIGYESSKALWFYLPVMLAIKMPLATLLPLVASFLAPGPKLKWAAGPLVVAVTLAFLMRVDIGVRLLLPLLTLVVIAMAARVSQALLAMSSTSRRVGVSGVVAAIAWLVASDLRVWPDAIRYTNELWGNTSNGYLYVTDSNYDWGQGLPELSAWHADRSAPLNVWYFGTDSSNPSLTRYDPARESLDRAIPPGGFLAVGTSYLYGGYTPDGPARTLMLRLRASQPVARTRTFLIFDETAR